MASSSQVDVDDEERDWSGGLPTELAQEITSRFRFSGDRVRFAAVTASWRRAAAPSVSASASASAKRTRNPPPPPSHPPWLMLPGLQGEKDSHRSFYSFSERKLYQIHLPQIQGHHCVGSGKGWIITVNNLTGDLQLLDLLTSSTLPLPSITTFSDVADDGIFDRHGRLTGYMCRLSRSMDDPQPPELPKPEKFRFRKLEHMYSFYKKAVFFPSASLVFVIYNRPNRLAFARLGDESWNEFDIDCSCIRDVASLLLGDEKSAPCSKDCSSYGDVVFHKGQFYTTVPPGWILALDLSSTPPKCTCVLRPPLLSMNSVRTTIYLLESPDGAELIQVWRFVNWGQSYLTNDFIVFKRKLNNDDGHEAMWVEMKSLDEWVLFLGETLSLALSTKDFPELTPNSIYFTHGTYFYRGEVREAERLEMGVFHLESETIEPLLFPDDKVLPSHMTWPLPVWIPHTEYFPVVTQIAEVEDMTKRTKIKFDDVEPESVTVRGVLRVPYRFTVKREHKFYPCVGSQSKQWAWIKLIK